jgi:ribosomal-protein-alanine N-acetyltransferase
LKPVEIRSLQTTDIESVLAIQSACPEIAQWTAWDYERVADGQMAGWAADEGGELAGFLVGRRVATDIEILNLAVRSDGRRRGTGRALLLAALDWGKSFRAEKALLEVRASNFAALRFYERHNFQVAGRRSNYYTAPVEDALLLTAPLD